jgi:hypothetical protein
MVIVNILGSKLAVDKEDTCYRITTETDETPNQIT